MSLSFCLASLMMCGVLAVMFEQYKDAQTFFERTTSIGPSNVVAWVLLGEIKVGFHSLLSERCCSPANTEHMLTPSTNTFQLVEQQMSASQCCTTPI